MRSAPLNLFQCAMLRWRELHPYCAAHVVAVAAPLDEPRLRAAIAGVLEDCGLTGFRLDAQRRQMAFEGGPAHVTLAVVAGDLPPFDAAAREMEASLNRPFPAAGAYDPFRFFAVRDGDGCLVGIVYDHIVAGGDSIAVLITDVAARYAAGRREEVPLAPLALASRTCRALFARQPAALGRAMVALPGLIRGWRTVVRPKYADPADGYNGFVHFAVDAAHYERLRAKAKSLGVTTNDLLLAGVMLAVAPLAGERDPRRRRHGIAIASVVNLRADFQPPAALLFGQFLSSFRVVHPLPPGTSLEALARDVGVQTRRARRERLHFLTLLAMSLAGALWRFASAERRQRLYLKYHPVLAGFSPLNVDALRRHGPPAAYLRGSATGPMSPLVVSPCTSAGALRVGITYRTTAVRPDDARAVAHALQRTIHSL